MTENTPDDESDGGEVSEVQRLDPEKSDEPVTDGDQITAYPPSGSGEPDLGEESGPDADQFRDRPTE